jgi:starch synthase
MDVLFAVSECAPFLKTGGLADVAGALPKALARRACARACLMPAYAALSDLAAQGRPLGAVDGLGGPLQAVAVEAEGIELILLDAPSLYQRSGGPYIDAAGADWADNHIRFGALSRAAASIARDGIDGWKPDILHAHDWQTALAPAYLKLDGAGGPPSVFTIHNMAFQGVFPPSEIDALGLPSAAFNVDGYEYWGQIGMLKAGLVYADRITTVSPTYARELATPEFGMGLQGVRRAPRRPLRAC